MSRKNYQQGGEARVPLSDDPEENVRRLLEVAEERRRRSIEENKSIQDVGMDVGLGTAEGATAGAAGAAGVGAAARNVNTRPRAGEGLDAKAHIPRGVRGMSSEMPRSRTKMGRLATMLSEVPHLLRGAGDEAVETSARRPKQSMALETAGGAGAGALTTLGEEADYGPGAQTVLGVTGGVAAGAAPGAATNVARRASRWGMDNLVPVVSQMPIVRGTPYAQRVAEDAARTRAARQMQRRATEDPERLSERVGSGDESVSPARRTEDPGLIAQERAVLQEDPVMSRKFFEDVEEAAMRAEGEMSGLYGTPEGKTEWEQTLFQRGSAGTREIQPSSTEDMLDQAYQSFDDAYAPLRDYAVRPQIVRPSRKTGLKTLLDNVPSSNRVDAADDTRQRVQRGLKNAYSSFQRKLKSGKYGPEAASGDVINLRSKIRDLARKAAKSGDDERARLYNMAADKTTEVLGSQLPRDARRSLQAADKRYREYKVLEDAVFRAGDRDIKPGDVLNSLRRNYGSRGGYARGAQSEFRQLAQRGREADEFINKPGVARRMVRGASPQERENVKSKFVEGVMGKSRFTNDEGVELISGKKLLNNLNKYKNTADALGMNESEVGRMRDIGKRLRQMQERSPESVKELMEDGPSSLMELMTTLMTVQGGSRLGAGTGASQMVLSGFMANRARGTLEYLTKDQAADFLVRAHRDPELYQALLTQNTDPVGKQKQAARTINSYLGYAGAEGAEAAATGESPQRQPQQGQTAPQDFSIEDLRRALEENQ